MSQPRNPSIQHLFDHDRLSHPWDIIPLIVYFPFGLCLLILRLFIGLHAYLIACILPKTSAIKRVVLRVMCAILGFVVKESDLHLKAKGGNKVIVTNHVTNFDHLAVDLALPCIVPGVWDIPRFLNWLLGFHDFDVKSGRETLIGNVKRYLSSSDDPAPILTHPEGATTNGRVGLLKFSSWPFSLDHTVHPIVITVSRSSPIKISPSVLGSRWWSDLFWIMMTPWTTFSLRYLESVKRRDQESDEEFTKRVQQEMASAMGCVATNFTDADKVEYAKRLSVEQENQANANDGAPNRPGGSSTVRSGSQRSVSPQLEQMALQVKNVLPQVPLALIRRDLTITANVDETITRFLDGSVPYTPEAQPSTSSSSPSSAGTQLKAKLTSIDPSTLSSESLSLNTAAKNFGKNASERMQSYEERKQHLIEAARLRYVTKSSSNPTT